MTLKSKNREYTKSCRGCALLCDDVSIEVAPPGKLKFVNLCSQGEAWYRSRADRPVQFGCTMDGQPADWHTAAKRLAALLEQSRAPLFAGMEWLDTRSQQAVVGLAWQTGGFLSPAFSENHPAGLNAFQRYGRATCTLGEIRQHRSLVCFWNVEPNEVPPRLIEKYLQGAESVWNVGPQGAAEIPGAATVGERFHHLVVTRTGQLQLIRQLRAHGKEQPGDLPEKQRHLFDRFQQATHVTFFIGKSGNGPAGPDPVTDGLHQLARRVNARVPCVILELGIAGNSVSAREVLGWSTGQFATGAAVAGTGRSNAGDSSLRDRLLAGNYDVAVLFESQFADEQVVAALADRGNRKLVCLDSSDTSLGKVADLSAGVGEAGWDLPGDFFRMDGLPVALDPPVSGERVGAGEFLEFVLAELVRVPT